MAPSPVSPVLCSPWATLDDVPERVKEELASEGIDVDADLPPALMIASEMLWMLSGRVWYGGGCEEDATLRSTPPMPGVGAWPYHSSWGRCACWGGNAYIDGRWLPSPYSGHHIDSPVAVRLPRSPITEVTEVLVDGLPFTSWRLLRSGWIERTDGSAWQLCNESTVVTYRYGEPPPATGVMAAVDFGVELARSRAGLDSCRLPPNVVSISRQGVTMELQANDTERMRVGLPMVDLWLDAVNPAKRTQAARIWSPDVPRTMRGATREV